MLTKQFIFLAIVITIIVFLFFRLLGKTESRYTISALFMVIMCVLFILLNCIITMDELHVKAKGICPEYEKLENAYKLK
jgi:hypothetical protein